MRKNLLIALAALAVMAAGAVPQSHAAKRLKTIQVPWMETYSAGDVATSSPRRDQVWTQNLGQDGDADSTHWVDVSDMVWNPLVDLIKFQPGFVDSQVIAGVGGANYQGLTRSQNLFGTGGAFANQGAFFNDTTKVVAWVHLVSDSLAAGLAASEMDACSLSVWVARPTALLDPHNLQPLTLVTSTESHLLQAGIENHVDNLPSLTFEVTLGSADEVVKMPWFGFSRWRFLVDPTTGNGMRKARMFLSYYYDDGK